MVVSSAVTCHRLTGHRLSQSLDDKPNDITVGVECGSAEDPLAWLLSHHTHTCTRTRPVQWRMVEPVSVNMQTQASSPSQHEVCYVSACDRLESCGLVLAATKPDGDKNMFHLLYG